MPGLTLDDWNFSDIWSIYRLTWSKSLIQVPISWWNLLL